VESEFGRVAGVNVLAILMSGPLLWRNLWEGSRPESGCERGRA
jgi:hypothetical protein